VTKIPNPYQTLGVSEQATPKEIKSAYRQISREILNDRSIGGKDRRAKYKEVYVAYKLLSNAKKRKEYEAKPQEEYVAEIIVPRKTRRTVRCLRWLTGFLALAAVVFFALQFTFGPIQPGNQLSIAGQYKPRGQPVHDARIVRSLEIASQFWARRHRYVHCHGAITTVVTWHQREMEVEGSPYSADADAPMDGCSIQYDHYDYYEESWSEFCIVAVHEYGHLVGYNDFPSDNQSIMYPEVDRETYNLPACNNPADEQRYAPQR
jgi:curved DNA-binding protein CbpA